MRKYILFLCFLAFLNACDRKNSPKYLPESVGAINSLSLVIDNDLWNGMVGDEIRKHFAAPVDGLPWDEPLFSIHQMPVEVFSGHTRNSRNILLISKGESLFRLEDDAYAKPQKVAYIRGRTNDELLRLLNEYATSLIKIYKKHDIIESQKRIRQSVNKETALQEKLGVTLTMSPVYKIVKQENNFFWIERQIPKGTMNLILYEMPLDAIPEDSIQRVEAIVKMRDSIGERYIPGRQEGMYMVTEKAYAPYMFNIQIADRKAIETRGMWEVKNFFMAGPFLNYIIEDTPNNRLLVMEGFTFAPSTNKRDYMFELEAILQSVEIEIKKKKDKTS